MSARPVLDTLALMSTDTEFLVEFLDSQREHVLGILEGLSDEQLRNVILPSGWSPLGMVKHLALDAEHYWFRCIVGGEPLSFFRDNNLEGGRVWKVAPEESPEDIFALYRNEIDRSNEIIRSTPLETPPVVIEEWWGDWQVPDLRFIVMHMIEETACHAGHLDVTRELIDGRLWMAFSENDDSSADG
jgi:Protein of unknown function (DUF664)